MFGSAGLGSSGLILRGAAHARSERASRRCRIRGGEKKVRSAIVVLSLGRVQIAKVVLSLLQMDCAPSLSAAANLRAAAPRAAKAVFKRP